MKVTYNNKEYECSLAYKQGGSAKLVDSSGNVVVSFEGVKDYSLFTLSGGTWSDCPSTEELPIAVVRPDGTVTSSGKKCNEVGGGKFFIKEVDTTNFIYNTIQPTGSGLAIHILRGVAFTSDVAPPKFAALVIGHANCTIVGDNVLRYGSGSNSFVNIGSYDVGILTTIRNYGAINFMCTAYTIKRVEGGNTYYDVHTEFAGSSISALDDNNSKVLVLFIPMED